MSKKILLIIAAAVLCIAVGVFSPIIAFRRIDSETVGKSFQTETVRSGIEVSESDLPLTGRVRRLLTDPDSTEIDLDKGDFEAMYHNLSELLEGGILPTSVEKPLRDAYESGAAKEFEVYVYKIDNGYGYVLLGAGSDIAECNFTIDGDTGKVISFGMNKASRENAEYEAVQGREQTIKKYLLYLGLDVLGDWAYNGNRYYSEKAGLYANMEYEPNTGYFYIGLEV